MNNYKITFFKLTKEKTTKGDFIVTDTQYLGTITIDDSGTDANFTLIAKAFRRCADIYTIADKVTVEPV